MKRQMTMTVKGEKIKIVSHYCSGPCVRTNINGEKYFSNVLIMKDVDIDKVTKEEFRELFIERARDKAYIEWVKNNAK